jgi:DNA polymerase-3 subunit chi
MGVAMFYHLTRSGIDETLRMLMERAATRGWQVMIRSTLSQTLNRLDDLLWLDPANGFLPHAIAGGDDDAKQPVLLGTGPITNAAAGLFLLDGAQTSVAEAALLERVWVLFDGNHDPSLIWARGLWSQLTIGGQAAQYWSEETGAWQKKSEKTGA